MTSASVQQFQRETIAQWAVETIALLQAKLVSTGQVATGDLLRSLSYDIVRDAATEIQVDLSFNTYGRILDMNRQKVKPQNLNRTVMLGNKQTRVRKNASSRKWYSKTVFGSLYGHGGLIDRLLNNYGEWALGRIVQGLQGSG